MKTIKLEITQQQFDIIVALIEQKLDDADDAENEKVIETLEGLLETLEYQEGS